MGAAAAKTTAAASATAAPATAAATTTGEAATATPPRKKMTAPYATRCSTRSTVTAMASPENQRAATDSNNDLDLAFNLNLDLDRDLDLPTATAFSATAMVPGTAAPAAPSCTAWLPPEAPSLKKYPMSYLPAHTQTGSCASPARKDVT